MDWAAVSIPLLVDFDLFCVSVFQDSLVVIVIVIDSGKKCKCKRLFNFKVRVLLKSAVNYSTKHEIGLRAQGTLHSRHIPDSRESFEGCK